MHPSNEQGKVLGRVGIGRGFDPVLVVVGVPADGPGVDRALELSASSSTTILAAPFRFNDDLPEWAFGVDDGVG